jgi:hypothetical protein
VDPQVLGWTLEANVQLFTTGHGVVLDHAARPAADTGDRRRQHRVGSADAVLRVVAADASHLERVISSLRGLPYVNQTDTILLLSRLLNRPLGDSAGSSS